MHQIEKIERLDAAIQNYNFGLYSEGHEFLSLCLYLIDGIKNKPFQKVFETMTPLFTTKEPQFLKLVLPCLMYYTIRFCNNDTWLSGIADYLTDLLKTMMSHTVFEEKHSIITLVIEIIDFLNVWIIQDKEAVKEYISKTQEFRYIDLYYQLDLTLDQKVLEDLDFQPILDLLNKWRSIKTTLITVQRIQKLFDKLDFSLVSKAALSIKEYGLAITYFELYAKKLRDANPGCFYEHLLSVEETEHIVYWYAKKFPDDYNTEEFKISIDESPVLNQSAQIWTQWNTQHGIDQKDTIEPPALVETESSLSSGVKWFYEMIDN